MVSICLASWQLFSCSTSGWKSRDTDGKENTRQRSEETKPYDRITEELWVSLLSQFAFFCYDQPFWPNAVRKGQGLFGWHILVTVHDWGKPRQEWKTGTWEQELEIMEGCCLLARPSRCAHVFLYNMDHLPVCGATPSKLGPPTPSH